MYRGRCVIVYAHKCCTVELTVSFEEYKWVLYMEGQVEWDGLMEVVTAESVQHHKAVVRRGGPAGVRKWEGGREGGRLYTYACTHAHTHTHIHTHKPAINEQCPLHGRSLLVEKQ